MHKHGSSRRHEVAHSPPPQLDRPVPHRGVGWRQQPSQARRHATRHAVGVVGARRPTTGDDHVRVGRGQGALAEELEHQVQHTRWHVVQHGTRAIAGGEEDGGNPAEPSLSVVLKQRRHHGEAPRRGHLRRGPPFFVHQQHVHVDAGLEKAP